jgi:hypothetical protein
VRALALLACWFFGAGTAYLTAQTTLPTTLGTTTQQGASLVSPQNNQQGSSTAGIDATVRAGVDAAVRAAVPATLNLSKSSGAGAAGRAAQLGAAISRRSSLVSNKSAGMRQAVQKVGTKGGAAELAARSSAMADSNSASASVTIPTDDLSSVVGGSSLGATGGGIAAEGQFPDSTRGTGWPSPPEGATLLNFRVGGFEAPPLGGFMDETHLNPSLMNVTRGEIRAAKRADARRRMLEEQPAEGSEPSLPGLNPLGTPNLTPSLAARPQFSDVHSIYPTSDLQTGYSK